MFCGGRSARMGRDKAFLDWHGRPLASHVIAAVSSMFERVVVSGSPETYARLGVPCIPDRGGAGPLAGLFASLLAVETPAIFAVACDMPLVAAPAVRELFARFHGRDAAVPLTAAGPEPLHACYSRRLLPAVGRALEGRGRMVSVWGEGDVARVAVEELPGGVRSVRDCDTEEEYAALLDEFPETP